MSDNNNNQSSSADSAQNHSILVDISCFGASNIPEELVDPKNTNVVKVFSTHVDFKSPEDQPLQKWNEELENAASAINNLTNQKTSISLYGNTTQSNAIILGFKCADFSHNTNVSSLGFINTADRSNPNQVCSIRQSIEVSNDDDGQLSLAFDREFAGQTNCFVDFAFASSNVVSSAAKSCAIKATTISEEEAIFCQIQPKASDSRLFVNAQNSEKFADSIKFFVVDKILSKKFDKVFVSTSCPALFAFCIGQAFNRCANKPNSFYVLSYRNEQYRVAYPKDYSAFEQTDDSN